MQTPECANDRCWSPIACESRGECRLPFMHIAPNRACQHDFKGWRDFSDGNGGEAVCTKCGMGAMAYTLSTGF